MSGRPVLGDWELPHVNAIYSSEQRKYAEFQVPGRSGSLFQNLNKQPVTIVIAGSLFGEQSHNEFLQSVRDKFHAGEPVTFTSDILTATELQYVIIDSLKFHQSARNANETEFLVVLRESPPPPPPPDPLGGLDSSLLDQAAAALDSVTGALDALDALGNIPNIGDPTPPLRNTLDSIKEAMSELDSVSKAMTSLFGGGN